MIPSVFLYLNTADSLFNHLTSWAADPILFPRPAPNSVTISAVSNADDARLTRSRGRPTGFTAWRSRGWGANTEHPTGQTSVDIGWISEKVRSVWMFSTLVCLSQRPWNPEIFHGGSVCVHHCLAFRLPKGEKNNLTS